MTRAPYKAKPEPGSWGDLISQYRVSPRVLAWAQSTMKKNDRILGDFNAANGRAMVAGFRRGDFIRMRDSLARTPSEANNWAKVIRGLLDYAVDLEMIPYSPARTVPKLKVPNEDGFRTWRDDEIEAYVAHWPRGSLPHLTLTLALCTGAARGDLVELGWANLSGSRLRYRRRKTSASVDIPILPALEEALAMAPPSQMTFLETKDGRVRSPAALTVRFREWVIKAGLGGKDAHGHLLSLHGLRKAGARRAAEAGADAFELMAWFGWSSIQMAQHYAKAYSRARSADAMAEKLTGAKPGNVTRMVKKEPRG